MEESSEDESEASKRIGSVATLESKAAEEASGEQKKAKKQKTTAGVKANQANKASASDKIVSVATKSKKKTPGLPKDDDAWAHSATLEECNIQARNEIVADNRKTEQPTGSPKDDNSGVGNDEEIAGADSIDGEKEFEATGGDKNDKLEPQAELGVVEKANKVVESDDNVLEGKTK